MISEIIHRQFVSLEGKMKLVGLAAVLLLFKVRSLMAAIDEQGVSVSNSTFPIIVITWNYKDATEKGILFQFHIFLFIEISYSPNSAIGDTVCLN